MEGFIVIKFLKEVTDKIDFISILIGRLLFYPVIILLLLLLTKAIFMGFNPPEWLLDIIDSIIALIKSYYQVIIKICSILSL
jgi:hypothetical protein